MRKNDSTVDAISLLTDEHKRVKKMFEAYDGLGDKALASKQNLAQEICTELTIDTQIEEEIFYPAVRQALKDSDLMDEADVEHAAAKVLIAAIEQAGSEQSHYD